MAELRRTDEDGAPMTDCSNSAAMSRKRPILTVSSNATPRSISRSRQRPAIPHWSNSIASLRFRFGRTPGRSANITLPEPGLAAHQRVPDTICCQNAVGAAEAAQCDRHTDHRCTRRLRVFSNSKGLYQPPQTHSPEPHLAKLRRIYDRGRRGVI